MRHSEGNRLVGWVYEDVSSHPPLIPAMPSLSHSHCNKVVQTRTSSNLPLRKVSAWAKIWARGCHVLFLSFPFPADIHQLLNNFSTALARCKSSQHLSNGSISPDPVSLDKTTFAFFLFIFAQNNTRSENHHVQHFTVMVPFILKYFPYIITFQTWIQNQICQDINTGSANNNYFDYWFICHLFSQFIILIVLKIFILLYYHIKEKHQFLTFEKIVAD